jgi:molybdopterin-containing oxidoreductase family iron-sulfur binding subunit
VSDRETSAWAQAGESGATADYWRSVEELLGVEAAHDEFPEGASESATVSRRSFMSLLGASAGLAGLSACVQEPKEKILPYSRQPPEITPGKSLHYATSMVLDGYATGLLVAAREGRPIKIEGNPEHPASLGPTGVFQQAALLQLYDPQRARSVLSANQPSTWEEFARRFGRQPGDDGAKTRLLLEPTSSPLIGALLQRLSSELPGLKTYFHTPVDLQQAARVFRTVAGEPLQPIYDLTKARIIVSLASDFLSTKTPFSIRYARQFADGRRLQSPADEMNRLYVVESALTVTGMTADHRFARKPSELFTFASALLAELIAQGASPAGMPAAIAQRFRGSSTDAAAKAVASDLLKHRGACVVMAGDEQPSSMQLLAHLINDALGNVGRAVRYVRSPIIDAGGPSHDLRTLKEEIQAGGVKKLLVLEGNPAFTAPADWDFAALLSKVPQSAYLGLFTNETAAHTTWFLPATHFLESWGDARAVDGTASIVQPLIAPLYRGRTVSEVLAILLGQPNVSAYSQLRDFWQAQQPWEEVVQRGFVTGGAAPEVTPKVNWEAAEKLLAPTTVNGGVEVTWVLDSKVHDGRFANNGWLQELADPVTKQTWGNAAWMSPKQAAKINVESGRKIRISRAGRMIEIPVLVVPGHADDCITLLLGYGREADGEELARGVGVNTYRIRTSDALVSGTASIELAPTREELAITQTHWSMQGRHIAVAQDLAKFREKPEISPAKEPILSLYKSFDAAPPHQWGMAIDLSTCTGCSTCVVACQAENNIPIVGKDGVLKSREMHWLRIDRYFTGSPDAPGVVTQPMLCQHCEKAPCEYVCPVNATTHSPDGINEMTYNRCVGTRFCQNNCPYKVRRFNWFNYNADKAPTLRMMMNPQVTVRARGVIEKCNFCVQRIRNAQITAEVEGHPLRDGDVKTACQMACPTNAIVFGNVADSSSAVAKLHKSPRTYSVLDELGTQPRVKYLARIRNTNTELG